MVETKTSFIHIIHGNIIGNKGKIFNIQYQNILLLIFGYCQRWQCIGQRCPRDQSSRKENFKNRFLVNNQNWLPSTSESYQNSDIRERKFMRYLERKILDILIC